MPLSSILLGLALVICVVPFVVSPFLAGRRPAQEKHTDGVAPELKKRQSMFALRDLEFDFQTGKIVPEDYATLRQLLMTEAAQALQAVETLAPDLDARIEAAVQATRKKRHTCPHCQARVAAESKFCSQCGKALEATCPHCHEAVQADDKFCAHCGAHLKLEAVPVP